MGVEEEGAKKSKGEGWNTEGGKGGSQGEEKWWEKLQSTVAF